MKDINDKTICDYMIEDKIPIPNEWYDDKYKKNHEYKPDYVNNAINSIIPEYKPEYNIK